MTADADIAFSSAPITGRVVEVTDEDENLVVAFLPADSKMIPNQFNPSRKETTMTTTNETIPLNKLTAWAGNVRKTDADKNLAELSASIAAHGLLQSLVVRRDRKGRYAVVAGRRRLMALTALAEAGKVARDMAVPCHVLADGANGTEISLVENAVRQQMHPADEFDAFRGLVDDGLPAADIAARFGVSETVVQQRLKLARVSPRLLAAYRKGELTLAQIMAFAAADDHAAQERVWDELSDWQLDDPDNIRAALTDEEITARDRRVKFVTLKAYEKAGGTVRRDLFAQNEDGVFIEDAVLLENLVAKKLERAAASVRKEGWKWVELRPSFDYGEWSGCERRHPALPADDQARLDALSAEYDAVDGGGGGEDEIEARREDLAQRMEEIEDGEKSWQPETVAMAGAIVAIGGDGKADIHRGYVKREDLPQTERKGKADRGEDDAAAPALSASLTENLTAQRSAAISLGLTLHRDIALAAVVHAMTLQMFYNGVRRDTCLQITLSRPALGDMENVVPYGRLEQAVARWTERLPGSPADLWTWCLKQAQDDLLDLLACCAACTVDAVRRKGDRADSERLLHFDALAAALRLDMTAWFKPTAANYFSRISKDAILAVLQEAKGSTAPAWAKAKKADLAQIAERELAESGWLPELLRQKD
jgi:ParB family chromosome partitioning protein